MTVMKKVAAYVCSTAFDHEIGKARCVKVYRDEESLRADRVCVAPEELCCGVYEVEITLLRVVQEEG